MVTRNHVKQPDHRDDGGVGGADEKEEENNAHDPAEGLTESTPKLWVPNCSPMKRRVSSLRRWRASRMECAPSDNMTVAFGFNESIAQPSRAVPTTTSTATGQIALADSRATFG